jgi:gluconate 2-dehydrogenase gamma chain
VDELNNRRAFLRAAAAASVAWAAADLFEIEEALAWAAQHTEAGATPAFTALTRAQADVLEALTSRILPAVDERPGAHEAGVIYFIDRALTTFNVGQKKSYADGIADLNRRASKIANGATGFAALTPAQQDAVIRDIEKTPFFGTVRFDTIVGTFALPKWGGNRDYVGWRMLGVTHQPRFQAPFGFYDADANKKG